MRVPFAQSIKFLAASFILSCSVAATASAQGTIPETLKNGCSKDLKSHCKSVTPGEGRLVACLYAYGDKLSADCAFAVYDAYDQLEAVTAAVAHIVKDTSCRSDIRQYCRNVPPGGGRIFECVNKHKATLTDGCRAALPRAEQLLKSAGIIQ